MSNITRQSGFRQQLHSGKPMLGTVIKTPSPIVGEILGASELDALCLDTEHAPFGRLELDTCIQALRAADMPSLVRLPGRFWPAIPGYMARVRSVFWRNAVIRSKKKQAPPTLWVAACLTIRPCGNSVSITSKD